MAPSGNENYTIVYKGGRYTTNGGLGVDQTTYAATLLSSLLLEHNANKSDDAIGFSLTENGEPLDLSKTGHELSLFTSDNVCTIYALYAAEPNPTISQLFMDGVTYDLKDKNAGSGLPEGGTEGQVLTKTATGTEWKDSEGGNTQTFSISGNTDKENAKLALDYYMAGNTPILRYNNKLYFLNAIGQGTTDANRYLFFVCPENSTTSNVHNFIYLYYYTDETVRSLSIGINTAYFVRGNYTASVVSALPSSPGSSTLYFITE